MSEKCEHRNIYARDRINECLDCGEILPCRHVTGRTYDEYKSGNIVNRICDNCGFSERIRIE